MDLKKYKVEYLDYIKYEEQLSHNTYLTYKNNLNQFINYLDKKKIYNISNINNKVLQDYIIYLEKINLKDKSIYNKLTTIKNLYNYLIKNEYIGDNLLLDFPKRKISKDIPDTLSVEEVDMILNLEVNTIYDLRNKAMLEVLYATGVRISELINLEFNNIDLINNVVRVFGKGNKERIIPINDYATSALEDYLNRRIELVKDSNNEYLFLNNQGNKISRQGFYKAYKKILLDVGINKDVSPHTLRHSFATHLIENGADLKIIQDLLGHEDISTTKIYMHISNKKVEEDYKDFHPRDN